MVKIKKKGVIFLLIVSAYLYITLRFNLYRNSLVKGSYFLIPIVWLMLYSRWPYFLGIQSAPFFVDLFNYINKRAGKKVIPWTGESESLHVNFNFIKKFIVVFIIIHFISITFILFLNPLHIIVWKEYVDPILHLVAFFLIETPFWALILFIYITLTKDRI